jgi:hypothetical protein
MFFAFIKPRPLVAALLILPYRFDKCNYFNDIAPNPLLKGEGTEFLGTYME